MGDVQERRQREPILHRTGPGELRDAEDLLGHLLALTLLKIHIGQDAVGGAQIDTDE